MPNHNAKAMLVNPLFGTLTINSCEQEINQLAHFIREEVEIPRIEYMVKFQLKICPCKLNFQRNIIQGILPDTYKRRESEKIVILARNSIFSS
jgi:hypothetical protein